MSDSTAEPGKPTRLGEGTLHVGRGVFVTALAGGLTSLVWGKSAWSRVSGVFSPVGSRVPLVPSKGWRIYSIGGSLPKFDVKRWRLTVDGMADRSAVLTYDELRSLPRAEQVSTFYCVTGWKVENVHWAGVRIADVLAEVSPRPGAHALRFVSAEKPYDDFLTLEQASLKDVMLAYEMDGKPLSRAHGAPLRLVIPKMYGYKNVKWLNRIELVPREGSGYWEELGYDKDAWVGRSNGFTS